MIWALRKIVALFLAKLLWFTLSDDEQCNYLSKSPNHNPGLLRNSSILTPYELKNFSSFVPIHC